MYKLQFNPNEKTPKYKQIVQSIVTDIERAVLKKNEQLPSISELSEEYYLARDTVEKAYRELKERGFITSVQGKGFYVNGGENSKMRILLVFNKLSSYKKLIYYAFLKVLGNKATVDLQIHHYDARIFAEIIDKNLGKYNYYVIMPFSPIWNTDEYLAKFDAKYVAEGFKYNSGTNDEWLTVEQIRAEIITHIDPDFQPK